MNAWADEGHGQFLYGSPAGLIHQLQRFQLREGTWTKHECTRAHGHRPGHPSGRWHQNGHCQSILAMNKAFWLADDGQYPCPLQRISAQHRREILQIWLVLEAPDEMVEDTQDERDIYLAKKTRHHHETLTMVLGKGKRCKTRLDCFLCFLRKHTWLKEPQHGGSILFFHRLASSPCTSGGFITLHCARRLLRLQWQWMDLHRPGAAGP